MSWSHPVPVSFLQLGAFAVVMAVGAIALFRTFAASSKTSGESRRSPLSGVGILLQGIGFGAIGFGPIAISTPLLAPASLIAAAAVGLLGATAIWLFVAAAAAMGKNWSVVARTRQDHQLVRQGPFATVRHPIYLALLLYLMSFAIAFGHWLNLVIGLPFFVAGTMVRVREEEKLLGAQFGDDHARYVREVPAFIPFIR
jgi:protein-S-isoprenylcysteine O-methyltransferase Ste14